MIASAVNTPEVFVDAELISKFSALMATLVALMVTFVEDVISTLL